MRLYILTECSYCSSYIVVVDALRDGTLTEELKVNFPVKLCPCMVLAKLFMKEHI